MHLKNSVTGDNVHYVKFNNLSYIDEQKIMKQQAGFGLLEVLIAMFILAVGVMGFSAMQARSMKSSDDALLRTKAMSIAHDLNERIRNNDISDTIIFSYRRKLKATAAGSTLKNCSSLAGGCSKEDIVDNDVMHIKKTALEDGLKVSLETCPGASGAAMSNGSGNGLGNTCILVAWGGTEAAYGDAYPNCMKNNTNASASAGQYNENSQCIVMESY